MNKKTGLNRAHGYSKKNKDLNFEELKPEIDTAFDQWLERKKFIAQAYLRYQQNYQDGLAKQLSRTSGLLPEGEAAGLGKGHTVAVL